MRRVLQGAKTFFRTGDMVLLILCLVATASGCLILSSATYTMGFLRYAIIQLVSLGMVVVLYAIISSLVVELFSDDRY